MNVWPCKRARSLAGQKCQNDPKLRPALSSLMSVYSVAVSVTFCVWVIDYPFRFQPSGVTCMKCNLYVFLWSVEWILLCFLYMYVFCMSVRSSVAAYLLFLFLFFFVRVKICLSNPTQNVVSSIFDECATWKKVKLWCELSFSFSFTFFLHSTPPACGQSTSPTVDRIPTTLQRNRPRQAHLVCSTDATEVTQKATHQSFFFFCLFHR